MEAATAVLKEGLFFPKGAEKAIGDAQLCCRIGISATEHLFPK